MGWFEKVKEKLTDMFKSTGVKKKPEGHVAFDRHLDSGKVIHIAQKGVVHPKVKKPRVKKLDYVEPTEAPVKRKIELLAGNAHEVGTKRNIGGDVTKKKNLDALYAKVKKNVKAGKLLKVGDEVNFSVSGETYRRNGAITKVGKTHYHITGNKTESGNIPKYKLMHDAVIPLPDYKAYRTPNLKLKGKEAVVSGKGSTAQLSVEELNRRKAEAEKRMDAVFEDRIAEHPSFLGPAFKTVSEIAKKNGISTEIDKDMGGNFWNQAKDPDYQNMLTSYYVGAMKAWRRLLSEKPGRLTAEEISDNINDFKEVLSGKKRTSTINNTINQEGKNAVIAHVKALNDQRNNSVDSQDLEDPEHPGAKHFGAKIGSQPLQLKYTLAMNNERLSDDVKRALNLLSPVERAITRMTMGLEPYSKPMSSTQIAETLNSGGKGEWDRKKVEDAFVSALDKIKANPRAKDDLSFHYDAKVLHRENIWRSREELVADLKKSYPDAIVAVNKLGVCVMLTDELKKSFSSDLATSHPGGRWITVKKGSLEGRHMYVLPSCDYALVKSAMDELTDFLSGGQEEA